MLTVITQVQGKTRNEESYVFLLEIYVK